MRYRRLDLNLLIALDALLTDQSVTRAAAKLNITQPAMSGALARLREYFEDPLIVQMGRQMELTPLARSLVQPIHDVLMRIDSVIATEPDFDPATGKRHFVITASDYVIQVFLLAVLARLAASAPHVTFEFRQSSARVQDELEAGEVDLVIGPEIDVLASHPSEVLFEDAYTVVAWRDNAAVDERMSFDQYASLRHVVFANERHGTPWFDRWFTSRYGDVRRVDVRAHSFMVLPSLVIGTERIATMQWRLAQQFVAHLPIKLIAAPMEFPRLREVMQWHVHRDQDPANRWLRRCLGAHAATLSEAM